MRGYLYRLLSDEKPKVKRGRSANAVRDQVLVDVIARIVEEHGLQPTRARESRRRRRVSACGVVAEVMGELRIRISEAGVAAVWSRLRDHAEPDRLPKVIDLTDDYRARAEDELKR